MLWKKGILMDIDKALDGEYGIYHTKAVSQTILNMQNDILSGKIVIDSDGVARYSANNIVVMDDVAELIEYCNVSHFSRFSTTQAKREQLREMFGY